MPRNSLSNGSITDFGEHSFFPPVFVSSSEKLHSGKINLDRSAELIGARLHAMVKITNLIKFRAQDIAVTLHCKLFG